MDLKNILWTRKTGNIMPTADIFDNLLGMQLHERDYGGVVTTVSGNPIVIDSPRAQTAKITAYSPSGSVRVVGLGKNLLDVSTVISGYYIAEDGTITPQEVSCYTQLIRVAPDKDYLFRCGCRGGDTGNKRIHAYDSNGEWIEQLDYQNATGQSYVLMRLHTPQNCRFIRCSFALTNFRLQLIYGYNYSPAEETYEVVTPDSVLSSVPTEISLREGINTITTSGDSLTITYKVKRG